MKFFAAATLAIASISAVLAAPVSDSVAKRETENVKV